MYLQLAKNVNTRYLCEIQKWMLILVSWIPEGLKIEFKPEDILLESIFGKYSLKTEIKDNQIHVYRTFAIYRKLADASTFTDLTSFLRKVAKADATKIVLTTSN